MADCNHSCGRSLDKTITDNLTIKIIMFMTIHHFRFFTETHLLIVLADFIPALLCNELLNGLRNPSQQTTHKSLNTDKQSVRSCEYQLQLQGIWCRVLLTPFERWPLPEMVFEKTLKRVYISSELCNCHVGLFTCWWKEGRIIFI